MTVEGQVVDTAKTENGLEEKMVVTPETENTVEEKKVVTPFKTFATQEEFDRHCAGVLNSAKAKAEKELLSMLGLKPDEKDKLAKFKDAYDSTLSEAEKQAKNLESLTAEVAALKAEVVEKEAVISALSKCTGKSGEDVSKSAWPRGLLTRRPRWSRLWTRCFRSPRAMRSRCPRETP